MTDQQTLGQLSQGKSEIIKLKKHSDDLFVRK
jgi:hypothetical protein